MDTIAGGPFKERLDIHRMFPSHASCVRSSFGAGTLQLQWMCLVHLLCTHTRSHTYFVKCSIILSTQANLLWCPRIPWASRILSLNFISYSHSHRARAFVHFIVYKSFKIETSCCVILWIFSSLSIYDPHYSTTNETVDLMRILPT